MLVKGRSLSPEGLHYPPVFSLPESVNLNLPEGVNLRTKIKPSRCHWGREKTASLFFFIEYCGVEWLNTCKRLGKFLNQAYKCWLLLLLSFDDFVALMLKYSNSIACGWLTVQSHRLPDFLFVSASLSLARTSYCPPQGQVHSTPLLASSSCPHCVQLNTFLSWCFFYTPRD